MVYRYVVYSHAGAGGEGARLLEGAVGQAAAVLEERLAHRLGVDIASLPAFGKELNDKPQELAEAKEHTSALEGAVGACKQPGAHGLIVLFFDLGWTQIMDEVSRHSDHRRLAAAITLSESIRKTAMAVWKSRGLDQHIRIVTAADLGGIVNNLRGDRPGDEGLRLRRYLVSEEGRLQYDSPKVVEAIVRMRLLGAGVPVFRIDWDALANKDTAAGFAGNLSSARATYDALRSESGAASFVFSGSYLAPSKDQQEWEVNDWLRAYATRPFPAFLATDGLVKQCGKCRDSELLHAVKPDVMAAYYSGLASLGADPNKAVISGALLCLSSGAILDLPPFSNLRVNVMWIDDHLKFILHEKMGHIKADPVTVGRETFQPRGDFTVRKQRPSVENVGVYTLGQYLPLLFRGMVMDQWIRGDGALQSKDTLFVQTLLEVTACGYFHPEKRKELRAWLVQEAERRAGQVKEAWSQLPKEGETPTFAALWVNGVDHSRHDLINQAAPQPPGWLGWGLYCDGKLRPEMREDIERLADDALGYVDWVLDWPKYTQAIRAPKQGTLPTDLGWTPGKNATPEAKK